MSFTETLEKKLHSINLWHLIWMSVLSSEILTSIMSLVLRGTVTYDYLVTGGVVSLIVAGMVILLVQVMRRMELRAQQALEHANSELENRVHERTAELRTANDRLSREIVDRREAQILAEAGNAAKSQFLANMSHELRTPLNHIIGFTQVVLDQQFGPLNEKQAEYLGDVHSSSQHLLSLINDILDLSKVEAGKLELDVAAVDLREVVEHSIAMNREKARANSIEIVADVARAPETIQADDRKLRQILVNLLSNAVKFTPDGGTVTVRAARCDDDNVEIAVIDTGVGISQLHLETIFHAFEQVENSHSRMHQGTGLGLSLTRSLVELHGGTISAESAGAGRGSTFTVRLPI